MKLMAVTYMYDMVHEKYSKSDGTVSPFPKVQWQARKSDHSQSSSAEIGNVWS
jgi:hypothetical protein